VNVRGGKPYAPRHRGTPPPPSRNQRVASRHAGNAGWLRELGASSPITAAEDRWGPHLPAEDLDRVDFTAQKTLSAESIRRGASEQLVFVRGRRGAAVRGRMERLPGPRSAHVAPLIDRLEPEVVARDSELETEIANSGWRRLHLLLALHRQVPGWAVALIFRQVVLIEF